MNKKGLEWEYLILMLIAALLILWGLVYYTGLGAQIKSLIEEFFKIVYK